ncbi:Gnt-I system low-affinity gluconate transporter [Anseongella ginsenosidimutans]|uniref:Gnt-I system low-affinity gluconate transporter n=1 Tax=Anseongella ginsenosidimutans TaxID=496056 RepID=A0A4R3KT15_9SPHI|nr:gluconate:H+ symporter [Anseongella ginsenosidimutans]QEC53481.1 gluconate transporter [Anseongella ginsenosidimutans]TCS88378.1 Gnt-I system low-affinity gluconate transporter [Anseongella ginsenosidimutans]
MTDSAYLLGITLLAIILLLILVIRFNVHAFLALLVASIAVGVGTGMPVREIFTSIQDGMGSVLGFVAVIVGLGAIFGQLMEASGGAEVMARRLLQWFGEKKSPWALTLTGFIISIPIFLDIGFIMLVTIVYALARKTGKSTLYYGIPLLAGLGVTHTFVPPTPGPVAVAEILNVPLGWVIFFGVIIGIPVAIIAGPVFGKFISKRIMAYPPPLEDVPEPDPDEAAGGGKLPSFTVVMTLILLPLLLIMLGTVADILAGDGMINAESFWVKAVQFAGHPFSALLMATLGAMYFFGSRMGYNSREVLEIANKSLAPAGLIILVTGAGGMFKEILIDSGVGTALAETMTSLNVPMIVLAYLLALIIRVTQGSATVAMITAAGMVAPALQLMALPDMQNALVVIAIASGATTLSHVNDSGFWLVNRYLYLTEKETLRSWSMMETIISVCGFLLTVLLSMLISGGVI